MMTIYSSSMMIRLDHLAMLAVSGADAATFLQGQLSNDIRQLTAHQAQLNGYCSSKGRLLAIFLTWTDGNTIYLITPKELIRDIAQRLSRYILRAQVQIKLSDQLLLGAIGSQAQSQLHTRFASIPDQFLQQIHAESATVIALPSPLLPSPVPRWLVILPIEQQSVFSLTAPDALHHWRWLDVRCGLPWIYLNTQEKFVPQMVNLEALGGVNFKKGCYPGQEVVARSQYLGKLKRRMALAHVVSSQLPQVGADVYAADGTALGLIVDGALAPSGGVDLLAELPAPPPSTVFLSNHGTMPLDWLELPYALPDNQVFVRPKF